MTPLLRARDVIVDYGGVHAVDELTLEVERGTLYGLIGPNGSGKSTFLAAVSRLVDVSAGTLEFDGRADSIFHPFDEDERRHMEYLRDRGVYADVPVAEIQRAFRETYPKFYGLGAAAAKETCGCWCTGRLPG